MLGDLPDVVITGFAMTNALASDAEQTWASLLEGASGIRRLSGPYLEDLDLPVTIGGQLREGFDAELTRVELRRLSYLQKMAVVLGRRAWADCGSPDMDPTRLAVSVGAGFGNGEEMILGYLEMRNRGLKAVSPLAVQMFMPNGPAAAIGLDRAARGGVQAPMMADATGAGAIAQAWQQIAFGDADVVICGAVESPIEGVPIAAYSQIEGVMSADNDDPVGACRPFDRNRDGMVFGEGGALLIMETEAHAKARGARILARMLGAATTSDGYDVMASDPGAEQETHALVRAIEVAGLTPGDIDLVNAHASGTVAGDLVEATALGKAFGTHRPAVYAPKAALGNTFGSAGAIEAILTVQALRDGIVAPTLNLKQLDERIDLDVVTDGPRRSDYRYAVSDTFAFGGHNVVLVFGKY
ncbi:3-oxoacyl-ACP synthase [Mycobacterium antarcticum]|uniref:KasA/KasB family beta-ketoacyl-ACP synthase n=1 Tax=unclassified Mycolicibacterium TaxID=2636767 RepID=UPI0023835396|nr:MULTISPECIES: KasA/KasB family beta-ketoacyl-ACP synthase [unclassified Mycolicibacterium]BDX30532.1 3-oxoacyl-ACP synthase [Mycolicibacterium sp. TUM20985]GLP79656.1 3-oxoacyl-ACP synthase [Mycolicibacterium sp. TUM20984]